MKDLFKKNQLMITALAIMIAIAGYLQFAGTNLEDEYLMTQDGQVSDVNSTGVITENLTAGTVEDSYLLDGDLELSAEDLNDSYLTDIESLDSEVDVVMEDYLDEDMEVAANSQDPDQVAEAITEYIKHETNG